MNAHKLLIVIVAYTEVDYYTLTVDRSYCCKAGVEALRLQVVVYRDAVSYTHLTLPTILLV